MALNTAVQRLAAARAAISAAGLVAREATVQAIAPLIPEGWFVQWHQSDNIYDDSNYHFDVENVWLATERVPRRTAIRRAAVPEVPQVNARSTYNRIMVTRPYSLAAILRPFRMADETQTAPWIKIWRPSETL